MKTADAHFAGAPSASTISTTPATIVTRERAGVDPAAPGRLHLGGRVRERVVEQRDVGQVGPVLPRVDRDVRRIVGRDRTGQFARARSWRDRRRRSGVMDTA